MRGKASRFRREKRPTHLGCVVRVIKQERICGGKRNKLFVFLFFFLSAVRGSKKMKKDEKGLIIQRTKGH